MPAPTSQSLPAAVVAAMAGVVDYAGLFAPAALSMPDALAAWVDAGTGEHAWLLGRFVVPAARLAELREHLTSAHTPLRLSVIVSDRSEADLGALAQCDATTIVLDAIECKPRDLDGVDWLAAGMAGRAADVYVEVDPAADLPVWFDRLAALRLRAKIRTGGTVATAFPEPRAVVDFMAAAIRARVPLKATAGLHHAVRGPYRLTYEPDSPEAVMHGYLNVLLAAAALRDGRPRELAERVLAETDPGSLAFEGESIRWHGIEWPAALLRAARSENVIGFGSCSINEPGTDMRALLSRRHSSERS